MIDDHAAARKTADDIRKAAMNKSTANNNNTSTQPFDGESRNKHTSSPARNSDSQPDKSDRLAKYIILSKPGESLQKMNERQEVCFRIIGTKFLEYLDSLQSNAVVKPLRLYCGGTAGSGKSLIIKKVRELFNDYEKEYILAVAAYTGAAACNIDGRTLHSVIHENPKRDSGGTNKENLENDVQHLQFLPDSHTD